MRDVVIVEAVRSPIGRRRKGLADVHPVELAGQVLRGLIDRSGLDPPLLVDDVIMGCVSQAGGTGGGTSHGWLRSPQGGRNPFPASPSTDSADHRSRQYISPQRRSCQVCRTSWWPRESSR